MNCAQHPDTPAVAYCRTCGKALCESCKRDVQGTIFCDPCLAARVHGAASGNFGAASYGAAGGYGPARPPEDASPGLALFLGFIPGVGAFYNGQFMKGFVHVVIFATLIWLSDHGMGGFAGILIMAWFFYMVFDAFTTAKARRYGLPIPDPLGLNAILEGRDGTFRQRVEEAGERLGAQVETAAQQVEHHWRKAGGAAPGAAATNFAPGETNQAAGPNPAVGAENSTPPPGAAAPPYSGPQGTYYAGPEGTTYVPPEMKPREHSPVGAVVLIGLGMIFLLANLGWFSFHWVSHFWPMILIVIGLWLFVKRQRGGR
jgi:TM2 domain-containing membrane protein YozV